MQRRRLIAGMAAAAAAALVLTGCSSGSSAGGSQSKDSLTWSMWIAGKEDQAAWQKVADTVDQVPTSVKRGVPVGLAVLAALRTVQQVRSRLRQDRRDDRYAGANYPVDEYAS